MSRSLFISIGVALSCVLSVIGCKKNIDKEIRDFVASSVVVPYDKFDKPILFNVGKDDTEALYRSLCRSRIEGIVYFDTLNVFMKNNPHIPQENIYHTFVIDKNGKVLLVGNPFQNDRMTALLNKILVSKK